MPRKKQRRAWGSITEVQRGKRYVLRWPDPSKRCGRASLTVRGTYREACERLDVIHAEALSAPVRSGHLTLGEVAKKWWLPDLDARVADGEIKASTAEAYKTTWDAHVSRRWADVPCVDIRQSDVQDWLASMTKATAAASSLVAKAVMDVAVLREEADVNRFRANYRMPKAGGTRTKDVLTLEEARQVLANVRGVMLEPAVIMTCFGGCRVAEALAVSVDDVRFERKRGELFAVVNVRRQMGSRGHEPREIGDMKNSQSERVTVVPPPYSERLREIRDDRVSEGIEWITNRGDGLPCNAKVASNAWKAGWGEVGIEDKWVTLQNMRPSWRTFAAGRWKVDPQTLEVMMGHQLPGVSGKHYIRPDERLIVDTFEDDYLAKYRSS